MQIDGGFGLKRRHSCLTAPYQYSHGRCRAVSTPTLFDEEGFLVLSIGQLGTLRNKAGDPIPRQPHRLTLNCSSRHKAVS